ncbi:MAG: hypothetical protein ACC628_12345 [Pirellulaceae bacterium]
MTPLIATLVAISSVGASIRDADMENQNQVFQRFWGAEFVWKFDELPTEGKVPDFRQPYSGYIYPDTAGGTIRVLRKYDMAFHGGRPRASSYEQWDTTAYRKPVHRRAGLFGLRRTTVMQTPYWHGHCNGWTAASIRHAEPQQSVRRGNVVFSPADIKGLLAEIYIYNENENLTGLNYTLNAGTFHAIIANWLGRGSHPLAMEADPGAEKWNYPIYGYEVTSMRRSSHQVDVRVNLTYAMNSNGEQQRSPRLARIKQFAYVLNLNDAGEIVGGSFYRGSNRIDLLWVPLRPKQGGQKGNERGCPHLDIDEVLAIWRDSVPEEIRNQWLVIDPPEEDRVADLAGVEGLTPLQKFPTIESSEPETAPAENVAAGVTPTTTTTTTPTTTTTTTTPTTTDDTPSASSE